MCIYHTWNVLLLKQQRQRYWQSILSKEWKNHGEISTTRFNGNGRGWRRQVFLNKDKKQRKRQQGQTCCESWRSMNGFDWTISKFACWLRMLHTLMVSSNAARPRGNGKVTWPDWPLSERIDARCNSTRRLYTSLSAPRLTMKSSPRQYLFASLSTADSGKSKEGTHHTKVQKHRTNIKVIQKSLRCDA